MRFHLADTNVCPTLPRLSRFERSDYHGCMKVLLASPRGFCAGVNMAIESLDLALASLEPPIYVYHEIVHNKYVVEHFRGRGVTFRRRLG